MDAVGPKKQRERSGYPNKTRELFFFLRRSGTHLELAARFLPKHDS